MTYNDEYQLAIAQRVIEDVVEKFISGDNPETCQITCDDVPRRHSVVPQDQIHTFLGVLREYAQRLQARIDQKAARTDSPTLEVPHARPKDVPTPPPRRRA